jgi:hypothetical protein
LENCIRLKQKYFKKKIIEKEAPGHSVRFVNNVKIDEINILDP